METGTAISWQRVSVAEVAAVDYIRQQFEAEYYGLTGLAVSCSGCPGPIAEALQVLREAERGIYGPKTLKYKNMNEIRFKLKSGVQIYVAALGIYLTEANATEGNCLVALGTVRNAENAFEVLPEGWQKEAEDYAKKLTKKSKQAEAPAAEAPAVQTPTAEAEQAGKVIEASKSKKSGKPKS